MSDHFEKVKSEILRRTSKNGGPTPADLLDAIEATNEDFDAGLGTVSLLLSEHVKEDKARARAQADVCAANHRKLISEEFTHQHAADEVDNAEMHAVLIADAAEKAAIKAANLVAETARKVAGVRVAAAEDAAVVLTDAAKEAPKRFTREQLVANFWIFVGLIVLSGIINSLTDLLFK
jgi:hypothetical protein